MPSPLVSARDVRSLADALEAELRALGNPARAPQEKRYLKSSLVHLGTGMPAIRRTAVAFSKTRPELDRATLLAVCEALWARGVHECRAVAVELLDVRNDLLVEEDLGGILERFLRDARTWALVDGLAASVAGPLVERFPALAATLDRWARDDDFWIRRSALLAELVALREGRGDFGRFGRHADGMLEETEFFVRKAIGWVLRDTSRKNPGRVARWLLPRAGRASGLTLREATKYLPAADRAAILAAGARARAPGPDAARRSRRAARPRPARRRPTSR